MKRYVADSLIETVLSRDAQQLPPIAKPALLRHLFALAAAYPAQILSYSKMLGQLQDAGNTTTLANYLRMFGIACLVTGLELFSRGKVRQRGSSPKFVLWNNALINALSLLARKQAEADGASWGRLVAHGERIWALEIKSGRPGKLSGLQAFRKRYPRSKAWVVGSGGVRLEEFFGREAPEWFGAV